MELSSWGPTRHLHIESLIGSCTTHNIWIESFPCCKQAKQWHFIKTCLSGPDTASRWFPRGQQSSWIPLCRQPEQLRTRKRLRVKPSLITTDIHHEFHLKVGERVGEGEFLLLFHFLSVRDSKGWVRSKPGAGDSIQVSHVAGTKHSQGAWTRSWVRSRDTGAPSKHPKMGCRYPKWHLTCCTTCLPPRALILMLPSPPPR